MDKQQIHHIADLARLELTDEELELYGSQLADILDFVEQLREIDTTNVEPTAQVTGLENVFREDKISNCDEQTIGQALDQAPGRQDRQVKVKRVLE